MQDFPLREPQEPKEALRLRYRGIIEGYLREPKEKFLLAAGDLGRELVLDGLPPEAVLEMHLTVRSAVLAGLPEKETMQSVHRGSELVMELMVAYGLAFREQIEERARYTAELERTLDQLQAA